MKPTVLAVTVGGSCQPVVTCILDYAPVHVRFIASTGTKGSLSTVNDAGTPCKSYQSEDKPSIVAQAGLKPGQFTVEPVDEPDSLEACYTAARKALSFLQEKYPDHRYVADYTGGTKTMSVGLVMAALESEWELSLVKGTRTDLVRVVDGTEVAALVNSWEVRARQHMEEARHLFNDYHFAAAEGVCHTILQRSPVAIELQHVVQQWIVFARGFDAWDRFDHARAFQLLEGHQGKLAQNFIALKRILGKDPRGAHGYERVFDLIRNAERRAAQGRYDDAVARLYRTLEMLAQTRLQLRTPSLDSGSLDLGLLPEPLRATYAALREPGSNDVKLALRQDFELLSALEDPLGSIYRQHERRLLNALTVRNASILAHGGRPITQVQFNQVYAAIVDMVQASAQALAIKDTMPQFPKLQGEELEQRASA
jgi:hypothetical protein